MCVTWNQDQWRAADKDKTSPYHIVGEYTNSKGETALTIQQDANENNVFDQVATVRNVYSQDGYSGRVFRYGGYDFDKQEYPERTLDEQLALAAGEMQERGFTTKVVRVQGRTIVEWAEEGLKNEDRIGAEHVHPGLPENREPTVEEQEAMIASLSISESFFLMLVGV